MAILDPRVLDAALYKLIDDSTDLCLCSADPGLVYPSFEQYELARKSVPVWTEPESAGSGRRAGIAPFVDGIWIAEGTATFVVLVDRNSELVLCTRALGAPKVGLEGQAFSTASPLYFTFPGPV